MVNISTHELREQHEKLTSIMALLRDTGARKDLILALSYVNKFLYENMCKSMLEKDENGNYIQSETVNPLSECR